MKFGVRQNKKTTTHRILSRLLDPLDNCDRRLESLTLIRVQLHPHLTSFGFFYIFFHFFSLHCIGLKKCKMFHLELLVAEILRVEASSLRFLSVDRKRLVLVSSDTALVYWDCRKCQTDFFCGV